MIKVAMFWRPVFTSVLSPFFPAYYKLDFGHFFIMWRTTQTLNIFLERAVASSSHAKEGGEMNGREKGR